MRPTITTHHAWLILPPPAAVTVGLDGAINKNKSLGSARGQLQISISYCHQGKEEILKFAAMTESKTIRNQRIE